MGIYKILKYLALAIGVISAILLVRVLMAGDDAITDSPDVQASVVDPFLWIAYIILGAVILLVLFYVIKGLFRGNIKKTLLTVGVFLLIVILAYVIADDSIMYDRNDVPVISASGSKWVGAGLITFYILGAFAILAMLFSGVTKIKNR